MKKHEILAGYMDILDEINRSTRKALDILQDNANTANQLIYEILNGAEEDHKGMKAADSMFSFSGTYINKDKTNNEKLEEIADDIVDQIKNMQTPGIHSVSIPLDLSSEEYQELEKLIDKKMYGLDKNPSKNSEGEVDDDINFLDDNFFS